ncbi:MAG: CAP domain-containing protein, partial [Methylococcaceae bacterium]|nr:CAP domain-containing protein [Methylococcaceae bacterium]
MPRTIGQAGAFLIGKWLALFLLQPLGTAARAAQNPAETAALEAALHTAINDLRAEQGLVRLQRDAALDAVARAHSEDMAARHYLAHETPEGLTPPARMKRAGVVGYSLAGENVGTTTRSNPNREIISAWMASPV